MTTITMNRSTCSTISSAAHPGARPTSSASTISRPRPRLRAWIAKAAGSARRFLPTQTETPSDRAISTLSQADRLGERR